MKGIYQLQQQFYKSCRFVYWGKSRKKTDTQHKQMFGYMVLAINKKALKLLGIIVFKMLYFVYKMYVLFV